MMHVYNKVKTTARIKNCGVNERANRGSVVCVFCLEQNCVLTLI